MGEALKLKVPIEVFQDTLSKLQKTLDDLKSQRDRLKIQNDRLNGETFSGTEVMEAKALAEDALKRVEKGIEKVTAQRKTIEDYLTKTQSEGTQFNTEIKKIQGELPDLFA